MSTFKRTLLAGAVGLALGVSGAASAQFTNAYFFGDSLSDAGSYKPVLPPGTGLFTTNPGPVWVTPFANHYGLTASPANQGGNDYAQGGARVTQLPGYPPSPPTAAAVPIADADLAVPRQGARRPQRDLFGAGRRQRYLHAADAAAGRARSRRRSCRPTSTSPPPSWRSRSPRCRRAARAT